MNNDMESTLTIDKYGDKSWVLLNGNLHRDNGPAFESVDGDKCWYVNGLRHRIDGPAYEDCDGTKLWYFEGVQYSEKEFNEKMNPEQESCNGKMVEVNGKKYKLIELE